MSSFLGTKEFRHYSTSTMTGISLGNRTFQLQNSSPFHFQSGPKLKAITDSEKKWFFNAFSICQEPVEFASLKGLFSLSYSFFCHSSPIDLCLGKAQQLHTLKTFLHIPVFRECSGSSLRCFGSNLDH